MEVRTGSVGCVDDVVDAPVGGGGGGRRGKAGEEGGGMEGVEGEGESEGEVEVVTRFTSTVELVFPVAEGTVVPGRKAKRQKN